MKVTTLTLLKWQKKGAWIQITAGAIEGKFGKKAKYWAERFLDDGLVHIIATDAHGVKNRPPILSAGARLAEGIVGAEEADKMVNERPQAIIDNVLASDVSMPAGMLGETQELGRSERKLNRGFLHKVFGF